MNINKFFKEKDIENRVYTVETLFDVHLVETDFIIQLIKESKGDERKQIKDVLMKIDFNNGDLHHFFEHLANGYILSTYQNGVF